MLLFLALAFGARLDQAFLASALLAGIAGFVALQCLRESGLATGAMRDALKESRKEKS